MSNWAAQALDKIEAWIKKEHGDIKERLTAAEERVTYLESKFIELEGKVEHQG